MTQEQNEGYIQSIDSFLGRYTEGRDIFKNAKHWNHPVVFKNPEDPENACLPTSWLGVVERAIGILAREKYGLDCYDNVIEVITSEQMISKYTSTGMPVSYDHWAFGKRYMIEDKLYKQGKQNLAYEIVINTDPAIAYCMEGNSPLMQILVIAHASFGHNSFFKGNHLFRQFTDAHHILDHETNMRNYIRKCEDLYGYQEVEKLLDACHALQTHAVYRRARPPFKTTSERLSILKQQREDRHSKPASSDIFSTVHPKKEFEKTSAKKDWELEVREENLLAYMAENAPHLEEWEREIMRMVCERSQYFYPQRQTQVMNEGWASFWHYTLLQDLRDLDLINDGMTIESLVSHSGVVFQPPFDSPYFGHRFNPYALGIALFHDIRRICLEPTAEDRKWFPDIAGKEDWVSVLKFAMENFKDESFVQQYLSPKLIREFSLFSVRDDSSEPTAEVNAIHDSRGYETIREVLASNYRLGDNEPQIEVCEFHDRTDRRIVLRHTIHDKKPLDEKDTQSVLRHMYRLWQHPVILQSVDPDGKVVKEFTCPERYTPPAPAARP